MTGVIRYVIEVPGEPRSKARPRFSGSGHAYSDAKQRAHEQMLAWYYRAAIKEPLAGNVAVTATFYRSNYQRIDLDNLLKAALDAANGIAWHDDVQVTRITGALEFDKIAPRTVVIVEESHSTLARGDRLDIVSTCPTCGEEFSWRRYDSAGERIYCSNACKQRPERECLQCGRPFKGDGPRQVYCSKPCASVSAAVRAKQALAARKRAAPPNFCRDCGARLARRSAVLCRPCWLASPVKRTKASVLAEKDAA